MKEITLFNLITIIWDLNNTMIGFSFLYDNQSYIIGVHFLFIHIGIKIPKITSKKKPFNNIDDYVAYKKDKYGITNDIPLKDVSIEDKVLNNINSKLSYKDLSDAVDGVIADKTELTLKEIQEKSMDVENDEKPRVDNSF